MRGAGPCARSVRCGGWSKARFVPGCGAAGARGWNIGSDGLACGAVGASWSTRPLSFRFPALCAGCRGCWGCWKRGVRRCGLGPCCVLAVLCPCCCAVRGGGGAVRWCAVGSWGSSPGSVPVRCRALGRRGPGCGVCGLLFENCIVDASILEGRGAVRVSSFGGACRCAFSSCAIFLLVLRFFP